MAEYNMSDKEQVEMIKQWWRVYGRVIAIAMIIGLLLVFGWRYWQQYKIKTAQHASNLYGQLGIAIEKKQPKIAEKIAEQLMQNYENTPYAAMAALWWAKAFVQEKKYDEAIQKTKWVQAHAHINSFKQIARLRTARIQTYQKQYQTALATLKVVNDPTYMPLIDTLKGDIYSAMNKHDAAQKAYKKAQAALKTKSLSDPILNMKVAQGGKA